MSIEMMIYLIGSLDSINMALAAGAFASFAAALFFLMHADYIDDKFQPFKKAKQLGVVSALFLIVLTAMPSSQTATMMVAASLGKDAIASETGQKLKKVLDSKLDQLVAEVEKKAK